MTQLPLGPPEFEGHRPTEVALKITGNGQIEQARTMHLEERVVLVVVGQVAEITHKDLADGVQRLQKVKAERVYEVDETDAVDLVADLQQQERERRGEPALEFDTPGPEVTVDGSGTVLTSDEVAMVQGQPRPEEPARRPGASLEEALAWWEEQSPAGVVQADAGDRRAEYDEWSSSDLLRFIERASLVEIEYVERLETRWQNSDDGYEPDPAVILACDARRRALASADKARVVEAAEEVDDDGFRRPLPPLPDEAVDPFAEESVDDPLEEGLPIAEARRRITAVSARWRLKKWLDAEEAKGARARKRICDALRTRLSEIEAAS